MNKYDKRVIVIQQTLYCISYNKKFFSEGLWQFKIRLIYHEQQPRKLMPTNAGITTIMVEIP